MRYIQTKQCGGWLRASPKSTLRAQVSLEITLALIVMLILFVSTAKIFVWFGNSLANRHLAYEDSRTIHHRAHDDYARGQVGTETRSFWFWTWTVDTGPQVKESDVGYVDDYLYDRRKGYYQRPLKLVEGGPDEAQERHSVRAGQGGSGGSGGGFVIY